MDVQKYKRKSPVVDAVQVTEKNLFEVAAWCDGVAQRTEDESYVLVDDANLIEVAAYVGHWIVWNDREQLFKVETEKEFNLIYEPIDEIKN